MCVVLCEFAVTDLQVAELTPDDAERMLIFRPEHPVDVVGQCNEGYAFGHPLWPLG